MIVGLKFWWRKDMINWFVCWNHYRQGFWLFLSTLSQNGFKIFTFYFGWGTL